ncbi:hypothetical protein F4859DRAFT_260912 [Xylaria cf. heliscus]|nr:hypothetical protein F4859DRAFT_260912 [Xylaria cf. heliscus]
MLRHRRALIIILAALSLVYLCRLRSRSSEYSPPSWTRLSQDGEGVLNSTLGFAEIFVINLPERRDRRDAMTVAGAVSNLSFTFLDGLTGDSVPGSLLAEKKKNADQERTGTGSSHAASAGARGSWYSHMNAMQTIVARGLGGALVLEDDVDWDVRLRAQMGTFASAARAWLDAEGERRRRISRPGSWKTGTSRRGERGLGGSLSLSLAEGEQEREGERERERERRAGAESSIEPGSDLVIEEDFARDTIPLLSDLLSRTPRRGIYPTGSPYGDDWDVLWLGHCGADLPSPQQGGRLSSSSSSSSLVIPIPDDETVPAPKHLKPHPFALHDRLGEAYPAHTRVVHAARGNVCSLAYAVSLSGARKLVRWFGRDGFVDQWDLMLRDYCVGGYEDRGTRHGGEEEEEEEEEEEGGEEGKHGGDGDGDGDGGPLVCLTVQPPLISHHYAGEGGGASVSNIRGQGGGFARGRKGTPYVRLSVQENLDRLAAGFPVDRLVDQLPDDGDPLW